MSAQRNYANELAFRFIKLISSEASAGILLIFVAIMALLVANSSLGHGYHELFHHPLSWTPVARLDTLHAWINDALMAVFFLVVGLEIKREIIDGELSSPARRRLPVLAALAGMIAPALIYLATAGLEAPAQRGWAIPAATDIAFAVGVLALLGRRVPASLRLFLLTVAIVDDLGAVAVIALFYTAHIDAIWAMAGLGVLIALLACGRLRVPFLSVYLLLGLALWICVLNSGIHATVAGVLLAFTIPLRPLRRESMLLRLEHALAPWNSFLIVPLFGFANAGVALSGDGTGNSLLDPVPLGVALGLFLGKQIGIFAAIVLADRTGFASRPEGASWLQLWGMAVLCGIGFTMSLFIGALAFPRFPELVEEAKLGVLAGSLCSSLLGFAILRFAPQSAGRTARTADAA